MKRAISKKSRIAKIVGIVSALTIVVATVFALALTGAAVVSEAEAIAADMAMTDGANIRVGADGTGIRFETTVTKNDAYKAAFPNGFDAAADVKFGTIIMPESLLGNAKLTHNVANVLDITAEKVWSEDENKMVYTSVLADIPFSWYGEEIVALSYVKAGGAYAYVGIGGEADAPVVRSYKGVADEAYAADKTNAALEQIANIPVTLPTGADIAGYKLVTDFDSNFNSGSATVSANSGAWKFVDTVFGKGFCLYGDETNTHTHALETGNLLLENVVDAREYTGLIFYVDTRGVEPEGGESDYMTISVTLTLKNPGGAKVWMRSYAVSNGISAYYYDGTKWNATTATANSAANGEDRFMLPNQFAGYVYVPFDAYKLYGSKNSWANIIKDDNGARYFYIQDFRVLTNGITGNEGSIILDDLYIVK